MDHEWIDARHARAIASAHVGRREADRFLFSLASSGQLKSRAGYLIFEDEERKTTSIPPEFWAAEGTDLAEIDWEKGNFVSIRQDGSRWEVAHVRFDFEELSFIVPVQKLKIGLTSFSVAFDPHWISALDARAAVAANAALPPMDAEQAILAQCKLGHVAARAVKMQCAYDDRPDEWSDAQREWDIPVWFWQNFTSPERSSQKWETGVFSGQGSHRGSAKWLTLSGVHFNRATMSALLPDLASVAGQPATQNMLPRLSDASLAEWWERKRSVRDALSLRELLALARAAYPEKFIARDRVRKLAEGRKRGPKQFGG